MKKIIIILTLLCSKVLLQGQIISGIVSDMNNGFPVEYVNIGIVGKNVGVISDKNGKYSLQIEPKYYNDTLRFSCIGYYPYEVIVADFIHSNNQNVRLENKIYDLSEIVIRPRPKKVRQRTLGVSRANLHYISLGINLQYEIGILMRNEKSAFLKEVNMRIHANSSKYDHDTVYFRINIYEVRQDMQFENILTFPIVAKHAFQNLITVDLRPYNIRVYGDFLVAFENLMYSGYFCFPSSSSHDTYVRKASQGAWETMSEGASIFVIADVER